MVLEVFDVAFDRRVEIVKQSALLLRQAADIEAVAFALAEDIETGQVAGLIKAAADVERIAIALGNSVPRVV